MGITLKMRDDVSIVDLCEIARSRPVVKTPHVGNNSINNLLAAKYGFPILWVDNTIPLKDTNANPHLLIKGGTPHMLSHDTDLDKKLTTHVRVTHDQHQEAGFVPGTSLVDGHLAQMRRVFPNTRIETTSRNFARDMDLTLAILEAATNVLPHKWYRRIEWDGLLCEFKSGQDTGIRSWNDIKDDVYLLPKQSGWVIPNLFAIVHDLAVQTRESGFPEAWMLSGPDMINYLPSILTDLQIAYRAICKHLDHFPDVALHVVPFTHAKFVVRRSSQAPMHELWNRLQNGSTSQQVRADYATLCPDLWTNTKRRVYFSQHDMSSPDDICVEEETLNMPLKEVEKLWLKARADLPKDLR